MSEGKGSPIPPAWCSSKPVQCRKMLEDGSRGDAHGRLLPWPCWMVTSISNIVTLFVLQSSFFLKLTALKQTVGFGVASLRTVHENAGRRHINFAQHRRFIYCFILLRMVFLYGSFWASTPYLAYLRHNHCRTCVRTLQGTALRVHIEANIQTAKLWRRSCFRLCRIQCTMT